MSSDPSIEQQNDVCVTHSFHVDCPDDNVSDISWSRLSSAVVERDENGLCVWEGGGRRIEG